MVGAIISAVVEDLTSMMLTTIKEEVKLVTGVNDEVKKLGSNFNSIKDLLDDAEEQQLTETSVRNWLFNLKTVSYDMDDVLDEWKTWIQTSQLQPSDPITLKHKVFSIFRCNCFIMRDAGLPRVIGRRIKEIHQRLDSIATDKVRYQLNSTNKLSNKHIETSQLQSSDPITLKDKVFSIFCCNCFTLRNAGLRHVNGRRIKEIHQILDNVATDKVQPQLYSTNRFDKLIERQVEKDQVKSMILDARSNPHIISLVGMGGIGKTTLAKLIYNDSEIQSHFEKKIWVCVSEPFDEMSIAKAILYSLRSPSVTDDFKELYNVIKEIRANLNGKTFLLVLDDVWNESRYKWLELEESLTCDLLGSTILITTRKESVAIVMGCNPQNIHKVGLDSGGMLVNN